MKFNIRSVNRGVNAIIFNTMNTSDNPSKTVRDTIAANNMLSRGERVLVAVSGGPDSLVLLHFLATVTSAYSISLHVFHLNHLMRGAAASADAKFVERTAREMGIPATIMSADVPAYIKVNGVSPEDGARQVRRKLLLQVAEDTGAAKIALGHTADDRVETFLLRLLRGAGLDGLRSIQPVAGPIIRPLIDLTRGDIEAYCRQHRLEPRLDETNALLDMTRNKVRHHLLPLLEAEYNPNIRAELRREIASINEDTALLQCLAEESFVSVAAPAAGAVTLNRASLLAQPLAIRRRLLRLAALHTAGEPQALGFVNVDDILTKVVNGNSGAALDLPSGLSAAREYDTIVIRVSAPETVLDVPVGSETVLSVPGLTDLPEGLLAIDARFAPVEELDKTAGPDVAWLDAGLIEGPIIARPKLPGDRIQPLGMRGHKLVSDLFIDDKTARRLRDKEPVVLIGGRVAWVAGHAIDNHFKVTRATKKILVLSLVRGSR